MFSCTWILDTGTDQGRIILDDILLEVVLKTVFNSLVIPTTAWMGMAITHQLLVDAES